MQRLSAAVSGLMAALIVGLAVFFATPRSSLAHGTCKNGHKYCDYPMRRGPLRPPKPCYTCYRPGHKG